MAAFMANTAIVSSILGTAMTAYSTYQSGRSQQKIAEFQAKQANANAEAALEEGRIAEVQHRRQVAQTMGTQRASLAASGADISDMNSSAQNILGDTAQWGDYDARMIRYNSEMQAWNYRNQATQYRAEGKAASRAGAIGAGVSLLNGASQVAGQWYNYSKPAAGGGSTGKYYDPALQKNVSTPVRH